MLDNFIYSVLFICRVKDCKVVNIGMDIVHTAILTIFKITAIKFKVTEKVVAQIDWKLIGYHKLTNELFKNNLFNFIAGGTKYSNYNNHILKASTNTAPINNNITKAISISAATPSFP